MARARIPFSILVLIALLLSAAPTQAQSVPTSPQYAPVANPSLSEIQIDALGWLQCLLRIDTTNTPGPGLPGARLSSGSLPDSSRALLLMAHLDVVGVDKSKWTQDPFAATIKDGYLYGRGAIH